jgi:hypothetical protein
VRTGLENEVRTVGPGRFNAAIGRIEAAVVEACAVHAEWPERVRAGIAAALDFALADPAAARVLVIDSRSTGSDGGGEYTELIDRFADLLAAGAPRSRRLPGSSDRSVISVIAAIVSCHIRAGTVDSLGKGDPDLVFLALLPYVGFAEASRWSTSL